jgi:hypothetical protein
MERPVVILPKPIAFMILPPYQTGLLRNTELLRHIEVDGYSTIDMAIKFESKGVFPPNLTVRAKVHGIYIEDRKIGLYCHNWGLSTFIVDAFGRCILTATLGDLISFTPIHLECADSPSRNTEAWIIQAKMLTPEPWWPEKEKRNDDYAMPGIPMFLPPDLEIPPISRFERAPGLLIRVDTYRKLKKLGLAGIGNTTKIYPGWPGCVVLVDDDGGGDDNC